MRFIVEVSAKVETLRMDGVTQYMIQGRLHVEHDEDLDNINEPQAFAMALTKELWDQVSPGSELSFPLVDF